MNLCKINYRHQTYIIGATLLIAWPLVAMCISIIVICINLLIILQVILS